MAKLNETERRALAERLGKMPFLKAKNRLLRMDADGRLVYYRNNQRTGVYETRFDLQGLGVRVNLRESYAEPTSQGAATFTFDEVIVEPLPGNLP
jgi:hypothetical protein